MLIVISGDLVEIKETSFSMAANDLAEILSVCVEQEGSDMSSMFPEMMSADEDLLDISSLLDDDTFMSLAFE